MYNLHFHGSTYARVIHLQGGLHFDSAAIRIVKNATSNGHTSSGALLSCVSREKFIGTRLKIHFQRVSVFIDFDKMKLHV